MWTDFFIKKTFIVSKWRKSQFTAAKFGGKKVENVENNGVINTTLATEARGQSSYVGTVTDN